MASKIDVSALTLNPEEAQELSQAILEGEFVNGILAMNHEIMTGIEHKTQIPFVGKIDDSLKVVSGCTPNSGGTLALTQKYWDPVKYDSRFEHCASDLNNLLKLFAKAQKMNPDFFDRIDSEELGLVAARISMMLRETLPIKIWFSDTAADTVANGSYLTNGTDKTLYNVFDGLWKQIFTNITGSSDYFVNIAANEAATYAAQGLAADFALGLLGDMRDKADERLLEDPDAKYYVTRSIADNYRETLRNKTLGAGFLEVTEGGKTELFFDGHKVEVMYVWDRHIKAVQDNGTKWNIPHRALLTTPANIPVGTLNDDDFEMVDSFYDKYRKSNIMDVVFSLDAKHLEDYMTVAAY